MNGTLDAPDKPIASTGAPLLDGNHVLVWAQVVGHPPWPAQAPSMWRAATSQVPVTFLGRQGQTGSVSVARLRPLMCADEFKAVAVSTQLQADFECARIEAVGLLAAAAAPQVGESAPQPQQQQQSS